MFHPYSSLLIAFHRANFLARDRDIHDSMIGAVLVAFAATDTGIMVDLRLPVLLEADRVFRTVHITAARHAATAKVRNLIVHLYAGRTGFTTTHIRFSFLFSERSNACLAYSDKGVSSSTSSCISNPSSGNVLYFHTARSLCTQQRPMTFDLRGLNSIGDGLSLRADGFPSKVSLTSPAIRGGQSLRCW